MYKCENIETRYLIPQATTTIYTYRTLAVLVTHLQFWYSLQILEPMRLMELYTPPTVEVLKPGGHWYYNSPYRLGSTAKSAAGTIY